MNDMYRIMQINLVTFFSVSADISTDQEQEAIFARIGSKCVADPSPVLSDLEDLTENKQPIKETEAAMYHRAHLLLDRIGVAEGEEDHRGRRHSPLLKGL